MQLIGWRKLVEVVRRADAVLEVLDARDPLSTQSRRLESMVRKEGRALLLVLNKADLVPLWVSKGWAAYFRSRGYRAVFVSATKRYGTRMLRRAIRDLVPVKPAVLAVVGYPKVGKSSIINVLKGKYSAQTSPYPGSPGYTKVSQLYRIGEDLYLIDTPGVIPVEGGELEAVIRGGPVESIREPVTVASKLIERILRYVPRAFEEAYGIASRDPIEIMSELARRRGWFYRKTGEPLIEEAARTIIRDFHNGKIPYYVPPPSTLGSTY